ncbi:inner centromere protein [Purpureocillium lavendulum]|uniref:Inner centromere protein n=1 Tax=Purpureocillium lavendulum TaxID=1247861 RepID=A0AB34G0W9_9HYPO|nr:inner centromere protein [Purpureocillium lavendulum]
MSTYLYVEPDDSRPLHSRLHDCPYDIFELTEFASVVRDASAAGSLAFRLRPTMATMRGPRLQVGSSAWIAEERSSALGITQVEVEEFSFSARNELDWLNEHMASIFNENETNIAETFKTPGKLRGKTPRTVRKDGTETRVDSGYFGSQDVGAVNIHLDSELPDSQEADSRADWHITTTVPLRRESSTRHVAIESPEKTFQTAREEQTTRILNDATAKIATPRVDFVPAEDVEEMEVVSTSTPAPTRPTEDSHQKHAADAETDQHSEDARSPSDGSSPVRPVVRKSSLNFASLPAREPLTAGKSIGGRVSRTSHLDHIRTSYYNRPTGGKSLGNLAKLDHDDDENQDPMDVDEDVPARGNNNQSNIAASHTMTYTQRLQDQINRLGKSQSGGSAQPKHLPMAQPIQPQKPVAPLSPSPARKTPVQTTPGAFPVDDEDEDDDDWIEPPMTATQTTDFRPALPKSHSADVMEEIRGKETISQPDFFPASGHGHGKSASVSTVPIMHSASHPDLHALKKAVSVSNPPLGADVRKVGTPSKSPSRSLRESPLKSVKNKLSSLYKSSRNLLTSSAAISAEGKSLMSPSVARLGMHPAASSESVISKHKLDSQNRQPTDSSPTKPIARRTRASTEREKEQKRQEKEAKRVEEQNDKLERAREKEREKAYIFSKEQEKLAAMEKQIASKRQEDKPLPKITPKATRTSPRRVNAVEEGEQRVAERDVEMEDAPSSVLAPAASQSVGPGHATRPKEMKRPTKPTKESQTRIKQAPTLIRVNTGSQHSQYHPSSRLSTASHETGGASGSQSQSQHVSRPSKASLHAKPSSQSLRGTASVGRPKALDLAAKKKEQDEREAQRRRDAKAELERKRAAAQEEQRKQEELRRQEAERQKRQEREFATSQTDGKTPAQRKAAIEKAKQTRAPPPAVRSQLNGTSDHAAGQDKGSSMASSTKSDAQRPPSRMTSNLLKSQDESSRPVNAVLSNTGKAPLKRTLGPEKSDAKRRRTSETFDDEAKDKSRNIKGPPVRPSGGFKKDLPTKSLYGYTNAPPSATRDLFKATVTAQHNTHAKAAHPLDMAQISKGAIPFAPNANPAGGAYKTPARPAAAPGAKSSVKPATRSSPRFQNGESIELPEIPTDDEDEDEDESHGMVASWADSPDLRRALMHQETMDPSHIFGAPAPLNMEEVFNKSKDRWHKFRARGSSANWSGADRLTEDDIRKDLAARDKLRREGGWSYDMSKGLL